MRLFGELVNSNPNAQNKIFSASSHVLLAIESRTGTHVSSKRRHGRDAVARNVAKRLDAGWRVSSVRQRWP
jgi:hypothetical protein